MELKDLIEKLQEIYKVHGNIEVEVQLIYHFFFFKVRLLYHKTVNTDNKR